MSKKNLVTVLFADIEDSTGISNYFKKKDYENFLRGFHSTIRTVLKGDQWAFIKTERNHKFMGDEFIAFFPDNRFPDKFFDSALESSLYLAATLKYEWYFSKYNKQRLLFGDKELIELNVGINTGDLSLMKYPFFPGQKNKNKLSFEGFPITLAKRIQGVAEESQGSRIIVADRFFREYTRITNRHYDFHYLGKKSFKGIAQRVSCYEWLGSDLFDYLNFGAVKGRDIRTTLKTLHEKNPHNPWYATLFANYLFFLGEKEYYRGNIDNRFYRECADFCLRSIQNIRDYSWRELNELLFVCLEVANRWRELCIWSEQAFTSNPSFTAALSLNAKALYMMGQSDESFFGKAKEAAHKVLTLFQESRDFESLYTASFVLARYYSKVDFQQREAINHLQSAVDFAREGEIVWAYVDYEEAKSDFNNLRNEPQFKKAVQKIRRMWLRYREE